MFFIGSQKVFHPDELPHTTDPAGSYRRECVLVRRIHPFNGEYYVHLDYGFINLGMVFIDEFGSEFKQYCCETAPGVVVCELGNKYSYWKHMNAKWEKIEWLEEDRPKLM